MINPQVVYLPEANIDYSMDTSKPGKANPSKHRSTLSLQKTQVVINVYDLLPVSASAEETFGSCSAKVWLMANPFSQAACLPSFGTSGPPSVILEL